jgi:exosome complex component RRP41
MKRLDGRSPQELRPIEIKVGIIEKANGSASFKIGDTLAIAAVYGPRELHPKHLQNPRRALLRCIYDLASFSVPERKAPGPSRRSIELSGVVKNALASSIFLEEFPRTVIDIFIEIIQADAGTRCAAICAASLALADAGIPLRDLVSAVAVGKVNNTLVLDLTSEEEKLEGAVDMPVAYLPKDDMITSIQMDGKLSPEEMKKALELAISACKQIYELQVKALKAKYR